MQIRCLIEGYRRWVLLWQDVWCGDAFLKVISADTFSIPVDRRATAVSNELVNCCFENEVNFTSASPGIEIYGCIVSTVTWWSCFWYCWGCSGWRLVKLQALEAWNSRGGALSELAPQRKCSFVYVSANGMGRNIWYFLLNCLIGSSLWMLSSSFGCRWIEPEPFVEMLWFGSH